LTGVLTGEAEELRGRFVPCEDDALDVFGELRWDNVDVEFVEWREFNPEREVVEIVEVVPAFLLLTVVFEIGTDVESLCGVACRFGFTSV